MEKCQASSRQLHICFFPLMAQGHTIPAIAMAKLFASRGLTYTLVTTPLKARRHSETIRTSCESLGLDIELAVVEFPTAEFGFPAGFENPDSATTPDMVQRFHEATAKLDVPLERALREREPDCLVADMLFPFAMGVAAMLGIPRVVFHGISFFSLCSSLSLLTFKSDSEAFVVDFVKSDAVEKAVSRVMEGEEEDEMMMRARLLAEMARKAVEEGGSSHSDLNSFIEELRLLRGG